MVASLPFSRKQACPYHVISANSLVSLSLVNILAEVSDIADQTPDVKFGGPAHCIRLAPPLEDVEKGWK